MRKLVLYVVCSKQDVPCAAELSQHLSVFEQVHKEIAVIIDRKFQAGTTTLEERMRALGEADLVVLLITPNFWDEYEFALRAMALKKIVVPVLVRSTAWTDAEFGGLEPLPSGGRFLDTCSHRDAAWTEVVHGLQAQWLPLLGDEKQPAAGPRPRVSLRAGSGVSASLPRADEKLRVLMIAANPSAASRLQVGEELHRAETRTRRSAIGARVEFILQPELRVNELASALMRHAPHIVHFSGHGDEAGALTLVDPDHPERSRRVDPLALKQLFSILSGNIGCVLLSACYSPSDPSQAQMLMEATGCVIGTGSEASSHLAIEFSASFYEAIAFGRSIGAAFDVGVAAVRALGGAEAFQPLLRVRPGVDIAHPLLTDGGVRADSQHHSSRRLSNVVGAPDLAGPASDLPLVKAVRLAALPTAAAGLLLLGMYFFGQHTRSAANRPTPGSLSVPSDAVVQRAQSPIQVTTVSVASPVSLPVPPSGLATAAPPPNIPTAGSGPTGAPPAPHSNGGGTVRSAGLGVQSKPTEGKTGKRLPPQPPASAPTERTLLSSDEQADLDKEAGKVACNGRNESLARIKWRYLASKPEQRAEVEAACEKNGITLGD